MRFLKAHELEDRGREKEAVCGVGVPNIPSPPGLSAKACFDAVQIRHGVPFWPPVFPPI